MYKAKVNETLNFDINLDKELENLDIIEIKANRFHILQNNQSLTAEIVNINTDTKTVIVQVNNTNYTVKLQDEIDILLEKMGIKNVGTKKINQIKAPMPGLVLDIMVKEGDTIKKGDTLLILEAMKMENVLKAPDEAIIKHIAIQKGQAVDKNQLLIQLKAAHKTT